MSNASTNANPESGFTLVETLAALAIVGLLMASLAGGLQLVAASRDRLVLSMDNQDGLLRGLHIVRRDIAAMQRLHWPGEQLREVRFQGTADALAMVTLEPPYPTAPGPYYVRYEIGAGGRGALLVRDRAPFELQRAGFASVRFADRVALIDGPYRLRFSYGEGQEQSSITWHAAWPYLDRMPDFVRLEVMNVADGTRAIPALVVAPDAQAERACVAAQSPDCSLQLPAGKARAQVQPGPGAAGGRNGG